MKENCPKCGMPLNNLHTRMSCKVNQDLFDISMGMYDTTDKSDKKDADEQMIKAITQ